MRGFPSKREVEQLRKVYPPGTRIELVEMDDPYVSIPPGERGTVKTVDDAGMVHVAFDSGPSIGLVYGVDLYRPARE